MRYGFVHSALRARTQLVALLVHSRRMDATVDAKTHASAVEELCVAQLTGWRGFLRTYVVVGAPRSLSGLLAVACGSTQEMADNGVAFTMGRLHAVLQHADADGVVSELG